MLILYVVLFFLLVCEIVHFFLYGQYHLILLEEPQKQNTYMSINEHQNTPKEREPGIRARVLFIC